MMGCVEVTVDCGWLEMVGVEVYVGGELGDGVCVWVLMAVVVAAVVPLVTIAVVVPTAELLPPSCLFLNSTGVSMTAANRDTTSGMSLEMIASAAVSSES